MTTEQLLPEEREVIEEYLTNGPGKRKRDILERLRAWPDGDTEISMDAIEEIISLRARLKTTEKHCDRLMGVLAQRMR